MVRGSHEDNRLIGNLVKSSVTALLMEGNGYTMVLMPIKNTEVDKNTGETKHMPITDFDNI